MGGMRMKTITLPDEIVEELEQLSIRFGISPTDIVKRGISEYLRHPDSEDEKKLNPIGFGMWADRSDMEDSTQWVSKIREREWKRF
jgi:hypothetical protein